MVATAVAEEPQRCKVNANATVDAASRTAGHAMLSPCDRQVAAGSSF
jgi:hypothetical protein